MKLRILQIHDLHIRQDYVDMTQAIREYGPNFFFMAYRSFLDGYYGDYGDESYHLRKRFNEFVSVVLEYTRITQEQEEEKL
jgi:hypothetical protein